MVKITIVGAGNMGRGIATRAAAGGHEVEIVDRGPGEAQKLADEVGGSTVALEPGAPFGGEVVVFAVYYPGIKDAVREYKTVLPAGSSSTLQTRSIRRRSIGWSRRPGARPPRRSPRPYRPARRS